MNVRYSNAFKIPRKIFKYLLASSYPLVTKMLPLPKVASIGATLDKINSDKSSISRFGDGEFLYIIDKLNLPFQKYDQRLADKMKHILVSDHENILVGLPVGYESLDNLHAESKRTWKSQIVWIYPRLRRYLDLKKYYYNASMTRVYIDYRDKSMSEVYFAKLKLIWKNRTVLLVEGEKSRLGVGNDLFDSVLDLQRILGPMNDAFEQFDTIFKEVCKYPKSTLVLIALGPTATALSYELALCGYQAVDIGNVDIEYEWFLRGAQGKTKIEGKYTSEAKGGRIVSDVSDLDYELQIIAKFL